MHAQRVVRVAAYGVLSRRGAGHGTEVLLVRASDRSDVPGTWWLPGGGVEFGESPERAVVREVAEETGLVARVAGPPVVVDDVMEVPVKAVTVHSVRVCYPLALVGGEERPEADGSSDGIAWVPADEVAALPTLPFVQQVLGRGVGLDGTAPEHRPGYPPAPADGTVLVVDGGGVRVEVRPQM